MTKHAIELQMLANEIRAEGYTRTRVLPDGSIAGIHDLIYTRAIYLGLHRDGFTRRFCFEDRALADQRFDELKTEDDTPQGAIARR